MNASNQYFGQWKKQSRFVKLSNAYSMKFLKIQPFQNQVLTDLRCLPKLKKVAIYSFHLNPVHFPKENLFNEVHFYSRGQFPDF
jgi:hypothetical protein